ncbi:DUF1549 domain-containing protein [Gimesia benthica]|uniref:DUF1549 domain-containing protein n=1 Tax=Gimesia benthica TaxID=2608982 RepID=A0A6I6AEZ8_9PLAN|nr:DUF1549 domain-containing protein [Gimesia benthica]QGQ24182.1 DUF1549 domain-containing protein [Gimesia benthica]
MLQRGPSSLHKRPRQWITLVLLICLTLLTTSSAAPRKNTKKKLPPLNLPPLKTQEQKMQLLGYIRQNMPTLRQGSRVSFSSQDLDKALALELGDTISQAAPLIDDETFIRRASLDLTGTLPSAEKIKTFVADQNSNKRSDYIDELLETEAYARKWARYWTSVIFYESEANKRRVNPEALEDWLAEQFRKGAPWDYITVMLISATPERNKKKKNDYGQDYGPNNFVLACENKSTELASETARIFMGISIQCAECHDHPFDNWKRIQFHELAAFFHPYTYKMPSQEDPTVSTVVKPRFLLGEKPYENMKSDARRVSIAAYLAYNPQNYWFARAYVNRIWSELIGDGFYDVDSLGPDGDVVHKPIVNRIAANFRYKDFDPKWVFRLIMNSQVYQREMRTMDSPSELFTAIRPSRLRPDVVANSVSHVIGENPQLRKEIDTVFDVNPSLPQSTLEGSIQQALLLMNQRELQQALSQSELKQKLLGITSNEELVQSLYLNVLARNPTPDELQRNVSYLQSSEKRDEAVEDLLWVLVNCTEFRTKR